LAKHCLEAFVLFQFSAVTLLVLALCEQYAAVNQNVTRGRYY